MSCDICGSRLAGRYHSYCRTCPKYLDNLYDAPDVKFTMSSSNNNNGAQTKGNWEVVMKEIMKSEHLEDYTLEKLKEEFKRRGMRFPTGMKSTAAIQLIERDIQEHDEEEPDWTDRPPTHLSLGAGCLEVLKLELQSEIDKARVEKKTKKTEVPKTMENGWKDVNHHDSCYLGDECLSNTDDALHTTFDCFYCPNVECGLCCGLSRRQTTYTGNFICTSCRDFASEQAEPLTSAAAMDEDEE